MQGIPRPDVISPRLQRIAELARQMPTTAMTSLSHHIDIHFLREAFRRTRKDGATGVDDQTAAEYEANLDENLASLLDRFKSGLYRAPPVKRVYILKGKGKTRPIGIPTFEDKVLQRAVTMVLEAIYEEDFKSFSWGYRPQRRIHDALTGLRKWLMSSNGGWVIEVDIQGFFDALSHSELRNFLDQRVRDGVIRRVIGKWLNAGVLEDGMVRRPASGSPQGGVLSPLLSNIFLHHVFDVWFEEEIRPRLRGRCHVVRFADDIVIAFKREEDARRVMEVLPKRFGKFGLMLHPDKTRLLSFVRPRPRGSNDVSKSETFDFLGLTHHWARSRKGRWVIKQRTARDRFQRGCRAITEWCRKHRHLPIAVQAKILSSKLRGHYNYYGVTGNSRSLNRFFDAVQRIWHRWLNHRSQKRHISMERFGGLRKRYSLATPNMGARGWHAANL